MDKFSCVKDFQLLAAEKLPKPILDYGNSGASEEQTLTENYEAFKSWRFQPRVLRDVSRVNISSSLLGRKISFPVCIAPFALHEMAAVGGEINSAKAAESLGIGFTMSTWSSCKLEDVATMVPDVLRWFQLCISKDRSVTKHLVLRAAKNGFRALVVTVDAVEQNRKWANLRDNLFSSVRLPLGNLEEYVKNKSDIGKGLELDVDQSVSWEDIDWLRSLTDLPIILKGILTPEMAVEAVEHNVAAVIVSNHGGRMFDGTLPTINALPQVVKAVNGRCEVYLDGGVRNGGDVAKAIALGAKTVLVGRPIFWGLACGGEEGVRKVLKMLRDEFEMTMKFLGVTSITELRSVPNLVVHQNKIVSNL